MYKNIVKKWVFLENGVEGGFVDKKNRLISRIQMQKNQNRVTLYIIIGFKLKFQKVNIQLDLSFSHETTSIKSKDAMPTLK